MSKTKWDEKAANYTRFSRTPTDFQQKVFDFMDKYGVELEDKNVLDIGCNKCLMCSKKMPKNII